MLHKVMWGKEGGQALGVSVALEVVPVRTDVLKVRYGRISLSP